VKVRYGLERGQRPRGEKADICAIGHAIRRKDG
jgi:hypothetical protein